MKQLYAIVAIATFFTLPSTAQFTQNFEPVNALTTGCNLTVNADRTNVGSEVITGTGSLFSNPPVNGSGTRDYATPYLNVVNTVDPNATTTTLSVSFNYKLNEELNGQAVRSIQIGLQSPTSFVDLAIINMDKNYDPLTPVSFSNSFTVPTGVYRLVLKMGGSQGNGTVRIIIDDIVVSANPYYSVGGTCNSAPVVINDVYFTSNFTTPTLFMSVTDNDVEPNNETLSAPVVTVASPDGSVVFNADGSFTFTPNPGFTGTSTTFTYTVSDKGFDPLTASGLVTIYFSAGSVLPVTLIHFDGRMDNNRPLLSWSVANNEDGAKMEIERSTDGRNFITAAVVMPTSEKAQASYEFREENLSGNKSYYRIKIASKNNTISYSGIVMIENRVVSNTPVLLGNPVSNIAQLSYTSEANTSMSLNIYDVSGRILVSRKVSVQKGINNITIETNNSMKPGTYLIEAIVAGNRTVLKLVKQI